MRRKFEGPEPNTSNLGLLRFGNKWPMSRSNDQLQGQIHQIKVKSSSSRPQHQIYLINVKVKVVSCGQMSPLILI